MCDICPEFALSVVSVSVLCQNCLIYSYEERSLDLIQAAIFLHLSKELEGRVITRCNECFNILFQLIILDSDIT